MTTMKNARPRGDGRGAGGEQVGQTVTSLSAGVTLRAIDALRGGQQTFTREQVAYLMHLAYDAGRTATYLEDIARTVCCWEDRPLLRRTYEQQVADELTEMDRAARARAERERRPYRMYRGGEVDWETGRPARRAEPYSSPANGTTLGVMERDVIGRWAA